MIQKLSLLKSCTTSPLINIKTFHVYSKRKIIGSFCFTKNSVKLVSKKSYGMIGKKIFSIFSKQSFFFKKKDSSLVSYKNNQSVPLKKKKKIIGGFVLGFSTYNNFFLKNRCKFVKLL
jgi:hypothetical protein